ncbi:MAG TPA: F0F1 ATP synthase subunit A [Caulobacteraceae bacterium]|jgi:F-type H+-transporting ATPase subunit a|nr:F0F1 ATP synthase subunit A [Caulobacteraceae bacterium]
MASAIDPMHQFQIQRVLELPTVAGVDLSITNSVLAMLIAAVAVCGFFALATAKGAVVPGRLQSVGESLYLLVNDLADSIIGHDGKKYFPFVFTLFAFIMTMNLLGMFIVVFTPTSQLAVTLTLALLTIAIVLIVGFAKNGLGFFKLFVPSGVPWYLLILMIPIEIISFLVRPLTLALRLFGNMIGGHVVLNIFGSFVVSLGLLGLAGGIATLGLGGAGLALGSVVALLALEFIVAFLQAFVFAALACVYLNDVVNLHSH